MDEINLIVVPATNQRKRVCCNCGNNIRVKNEHNIMVDNYCDIDKHIIRYVDCFEHWCPHWRKERKQDNEQNR